MGGTNPWRELRERAEVELRWLDMPDGVRGAWWIESGRRVIALSHRLRRRERNAVLMHELVHDERGIAYPPGTPRALVAKEEALVDRITTERLVPRSELLEFVRALLDADGWVTALEVAEEFDVPVDVAERAMRMLT